MTKTITERTCACGGQVISNDFEQTYSHSVPECEWFREINKGASETYTSVRGTDDKLRRVHRGRS